MFFSLRKVGVWCGALLAGLLFAWFVGSFILVAQTPDLVYHPEHSVDLQYSVPVRSEFLQRQNGERVEVLIAEAQNPRQRQNIIVYLHGNWGRNPTNIAELTEFATVVSPAYPGFSRSEGRPNTSTIHRSVDVTLQWLKSQNVEPQNVTIFGHSLGGSVAVYAATQYPQAKQLILVNTFYSIQRQCQTQYSILCALSGPIHNTAEITTGVNANMPLYFFHNQNDEVIPQSQGEDLFEEMPNTDKIFSDIGGTHGEIDAAWVMQKVRK